MEPKGSFFMPILKKRKPAVFRRAFFLERSAVFEGGELLLIDEGAHGVLLVLSGKAQAEGL